MNVKLSGNFTCATNKRRLNEQTSEEHGSSVDKKIKKKRPRKVLFCTEALGGHYIHIFKLMIIFTASWGKKDVRKKMVC